MLYCIVIIVRARNKRQVEKYFFILFFVLFVLILVEVNKLVFFFKKKYDACAVGAPYFSKSFGATFQSYFREDKKLT